MVVIPDMFELSLTEPPSLGYKIVPLVTESRADKERTILDYAVLCSIKERKEFLGSVSFYRPFISYADECLLSSTGLFRGNPF